MSHCYPGSGKKFFRHNQKNQQQSSLITVGFSFQEITSTIFLYFIYASVRVPSAGLFALLFITYSIPPTNPGKNPRYPTIVRSHATLFNVAKLITHQATIPMTHHTAIFKIRNTRTVFSLVILFSLQKSHNFFISSHPLFSICLNSSKHM